MHRSVLRRAGLIALAIGLMSVADASAQEIPEITVRGRVLGPDSTPLAVGRVVLHRVDPTGGTTVAESPSDADGRFNLPAAATTDTSVVYFVAVSHQGELYIGRPFRPATEGTPEQVIQVGLPATSLTAMLREVEMPAASGDRSTPTTRALLLMLSLLGLTAAVLYLTLRRRRLAPSRALLIRIAEIDERLPAAPPGQRDALREERARLVEQLRDG
jgi:hypothetical protein